MRWQVLKVTVGHMDIIMQHRNMYDDQSQLMIVMIKWGDERKNMIEESQGRQIQTTATGHMNNHSTQTQ